MSTTRRETAAARAALARRRQRGIFTPSPTTNIEHRQSLEGRPKSLPITKAAAEKDGTPPSSTPATTANSQSSRPPAKVQSTAQKANDRPRAASAPPQPSPAQHRQGSTPSKQRPTSLESKTNRHDSSPARNPSADRSVRFTTNGANTNSPQVVEEQDVVMEEPEPTILDEVLDAKCLSYGSSIVIRSQSSAQAYVSVRKKTRGDAARYLATMNGAEVFSISKQQCGDTTEDSVVRYGDAVALRSSTAQHRTLGVRKLSATEGTTYEVGFVRSTVSPAEQWTILRGDRVVLVGSVAVTNTNTEAKTGKTAAVRSGDPILLRNNWTGGLLALDSIDDDSLTLVTDSYDSDVIRTGSSSDKDPLSKIQHHDRILPTSRETFQFVNAVVPPCPQWVDDGSRRMYENGSYLLQSGRNDRNEETRLALFGPSYRDGRKSLQAPLKSGVHTQERILLDEVIGSLFGLEGNYVKFSCDAEESCFCVSEPGGMSFDTSLRNLVVRILSLSTAFVRARYFLSLHRPGYEYGFVVQAVYESVDELLQDHLVFAAEMEQLLRQDTEADAMTMNKLYVYIQSPLQRMAILEHVVTAIRERKGGSLLNALHELKTQVFPGDSVAQHVLESLLRGGSVPYFKMLDTWLESGVINDPFNEFMIETCECPDAVGGYDGDTWNGMFRIRSDHVLKCVLSSPVVQEQILLTGKYWNAVQLCQRTTADVPGSETLQQGKKDAMHVHRGMDAVALSAFVHSMYQNASQQLLRLLMGDFDAMKSLLTLKRFFLLHQGDFLVHLFDAAEDELTQELQDVSRGRLQQLLHMCIQLTEPDADDSHSALVPLGAAKPAGPLTAQMLRCSFAPDSLIDYLDALHGVSGGIDAREPKTPSRHAYGMASKEMTGIDAFSIRFDRIPFPTSLIISQTALSSYQLLFRHLFFAKYVERRLVGIWLDHQMMKQFQSLRRAMGPTYCLRQRMLHFMQNFIYYIMFEVIEPNWLEMEHSIIRKQRSNSNGGSQRTQTVDDIIRVHNEFLKLALAECLLTNRELVRTLTELMRTCLHFSDELKRFMEATKIVSESRRMHQVKENESGVLTKLYFCCISCTQADENQAVAKKKRSIIQRNLNDPTSTRGAPSKKVIRKAMTTQNEERTLRMQKQAARVEGELAEESYKRMISRYDEVFTENLSNFMKQLLSAAHEEYHSQKANLCIRLDYNGYVTRQMGLH